MSGRYFYECRIATESTEARDDAIARKLWDATETMVGLSDAHAEVQDKLSRLGGVQHGYSTPETPEDGSS